MHGLCELEGKCKYFLTVSYFLSGFDILTQVCDDEPQDGYSWGCLRKSGLICNIPLYSSSIRSSICACQFL
jgi:hypothetical protein